MVARWVLWLSLVLVECSEMIKGRWLGGFSSTLGPFSVLATKLQGIKHGFLLAWNKGTRRIWCETDSQLVVHLISTGSRLRHHSHVFILEDIRALMARECHVQLTHVWREANKCVDVMARIGCQSQSSCQYWESPLLEVLPLLDDDMQGVMYQRV